MTVRILQGDCRDVLATLPDASVHCCVTSPPYWGLRDYGVAGQIGLEPTIEQFVAEMVAVFREVRRVLRPDGTLWLNLGDSYAGGGGHSPDAPSSAYSKSGLYGQALKSGGLPVGNGLKPKDLCGVPWRVAFALQADGWYLRQDIIWAKPNPMPESVTDRCTKAHEYIFLLTKQAKYFYDAEAIKEDVTGNAHARGNGLNPKRLLGVPGMMRSNPTFTANELVDSRNKRSVWTVATAPFSAAHFATFPPALIEPAILAGTSEKGCCAKCGAPWERQLEHCYRGDWLDGKCDETRLTSGNAKVPRKDDPTLARTLGWYPLCDCDGAAELPPYPPKPKDKSKIPEWRIACSVVDAQIEKMCSAVAHIKVVPGVLLDPFGGAGTTGLVADRRQRNAILIELNPSYADMAERRIHNDAPLLATAESV